MKKLYSYVGALTSLTLVACGQVLGLSDGRELATDDPATNGIGGASSDGGAAGTTTSSASNSSGGSTATSTHSCSAKSTDIAGSDRVSGAAGAEAGATSGGEGGDTGAPRRPRSCEAGGPGAGHDCGQGCNEDCCASELVESGTYARPLYATETYVSAFTLDKFEVTNGRFRAFVDAVTADPPYRPEPGAGKHEHLSTSSIEEGWKEEWNVHLGATKAEWAGSSFLGCSTSAWTEAAGAAERLPVVCVNLYQAYAFCIWDGGFLPTLIELMYAAMGGDENRPYPWGTAEPDPTLALYATALTDVGSRPDGDGRWGQSDLFGSVWEWTQGEDAWWTLGCHADCLDPGPDTYDYAYPMGGAWTSSVLQPSIEDANPEDNWVYRLDRLRLDDLGFRCARSP